MMRFRTTTRWLATAALCLACRERTTSPLDREPPLQATLDTDSLFVGTTAQLRVQFRDSTLSESARRISYVSTDTQVIRVDSAGVVRAVSYGPARVRIASSVGTVLVDVPVRLRRIAIGADASTLSRGVWAVCVLTVSGDAFCDDVPSVGTLPNFTRVAGVPEALTSISTALESFCGRGVSGRLICWGRNVYGQYGLGTASDGGTAPVYGAPGKQFDLVGTGGHSAVCGAEAATALLDCWGHNDLTQTGRLPQGRALLDVAPVLPSLRVRDVSLNNASGCAIDIDGAAWCWGLGYDLPFPGLPLAVRTPQKFASVPVSFVSVEAGQGLACALTAEGQAWCWGRSSSGAAAPRRVQPSRTFTQLSVDDSGNACGVTNGEVWCWHEVDDPAVPFVRGLTIRQVIVGLTRRCVLTVQRTVYCT